MTEPAVPCSCGTPIADDARFCSRCGSPTVRHARICQSNDGPGVNIGGGVSAGRDVTVKTGAEWDTRVPIDYERGTVRSLLLPPDLLSIVAGALGIGTTLLGTRFDVPVLSMTLVVVGLGLLAVAFLAVRAHADLRANKFHCLPLGLGLLERDPNGRVVRSDVPRSFCPYCRPDSPGTLTLTPSPAGPYWACSESTQHRLRFDHTQMPSMR